MSIMHPKLKKSFLESTVIHANVHILSVVFIFLFLWLIREEFIYLSSCLSVTEISIWGSFINYVDMKED